MTRHSLGFGPLGFGALVPALPLIMVLACSPPSGADDALEDVMPATVTIVEPSEGAVVPAGSVTVRLTVEGVAIVPAGDTPSGTGHHHLYLDAELTDGSVPIPTVPGSIIHMGDASAEYVFENVPAGEHRLIAVVADGIHVPLQPWVVDTVVFTAN